MKLYTYQHKSVLEHINDKGFYKVDGRRSLAACWRGGFKKGYDFIVKHLQEKDPNNYKATYPIWAFVEKSSPSDFGVKNTDTILLVLDIDESRVLLSDFINYHAILNNAYCNLDDEDWEEHEKLYYPNDEVYPQGISKEDYQKVVEDSWINIFNIRDSKKEDIQANFWVIKKEDIVEVIEITEDDLVSDDDDLEDDI